MLNENTKDKIAEVVCLLTGFTIIIASCLVIFNYDPFIFIGIGWAALIIWSVHRSMKGELKDGFALFTKETVITTK